MAGAINISSHRNVHIFHYLRAPIEFCPAIGIVTAFMDIDAVIGVPKTMRRNSILSGPAFILPTKNLFIAIFVKQV
jgi:hypothetical protein